LPWTFQQAFTVAGDNPYFCIVHASLNMGGNVTTHASLGPPGVPDGSAGSSPLTVGKLGESSVNLEIGWDSTLCPEASDYEIIYGGGSQLPSILGEGYGLSGGLCSIGTVPPFAWINSPDPTSDDTGFIWFLVVANDGSAIEGSWGESSAAIERAGPGPGGSSGVAFCHATKELSNTCGQ
jgi:hypothetical protein